MPTTDHDLAASRPLRNVDGLRQAAEAKAVATRRCAEDALALLLRERRPVTFQAVAATGHVSTAWLYQHDHLKQRSMQLRAEQAPQAKH